MNRFLSRLRVSARGQLPVMLILIGVGLGLALGVTLCRAPLPAFFPGTTLHRQFWVLDGISVTGGAELSNALMLVPFAFFAVLAARRPLPVAAAAVGLAALVNATVRPSQHRDIDIARSRTAGDVNEMTRSFDS